MDSQIITIGSNPDCDICINDPNVAEKHGVIYVDGDLLCLELMLGCTAYLNDNQVEGKYWLQDTDVVVIGMVRLNVSLIHDMIVEGGIVDGEKLFESVDSIDDLSDAVVVKHNWWPTIILSAIILAIGIFTGSILVKYQRVRKTQEEEIRLKQDSIKHSQILIDSLNNEIKQFEIE